MFDKVVAYYRVSTKKQGDSGLGLEGQQAAVSLFVRSNGARIIMAYTEVESGKKTNRPALAKAMAHAKRAKATLVVAKLDRLSRNVAFLSALMESGVDFIACDNPHANRLTIHILAAVAEAEAEAISTRTKAALAAYKARGGKLGASRTECRNLTDEGRRKGAVAAGAAVKANADTAYIDLLDEMTKMRTNGLTYQAIADRLNSKGQTTRYGNQWSATAAMRVLKRANVA